VLTVIHYCIVISLICVPVLLFLNLFLVPDKGPLNSKIDIAVTTQQQQQQQQQPFYGHLSGTTGESRYQKNHSLYHIYMPSSWFYGSWEDNRGRCTNDLAGCHPIWTIGDPTSIIPTVFIPDDLPVTILPIYPGLGQAASSMLGCAGGLGRSDTV